MAYNAVCNSTNIDLHLFNGFNSLPDFILAEILSFLPTKEAVATSVLSKRWEFLWTMIHNLDFTFDASVIENNKHLEFIEFVNNVLLLNDVRSLSKFSFSCNSHYVSTYANYWINNAIRRNVHHLYLHLVTLSRQSEVLLDIFSCASLRSLELDVEVTFSAAIQVFLPRIEILKLSYINFETEEAFEKLIRGCPILTHLYLFSWLKLKHKARFTYVISSISLKTLELVSEHFCSIKLEASSLEYLKIVGFFHTFFVVKSLSSLIEVDLSHLKLSISEFSKASISKSKIVEAVRAFDCAKALTLSFNVMQVFRFGIISLSTEFKKLTKFEAKVDCCDWSLLQDFIQCSDNLEVLTVYQISRGNKCNNCEGLKWTIPREVPKCLSNSLKEVVFNGDYSSTEYQREMLRYMLKHGSVLEVINISRYNKDIYGSMSKWFEEMTEYSRKSPFCEIIVNVLDIKGKRHDVLYHSANDR